MLDEMMPAVVCVLCKKCTTAGKPRAPSCLLLGRMVEHLRLKGLLPAVHRAGLVREGGPGQLHILLHSAYTGAWRRSAQDHASPVSTPTAEVFKASLLLSTVIATSSLMSASC